MAGKSIEAGRAVVRITTNDDQFLRGLRAIQLRLNAFGASVASIGRTTLTVGATIATGFGVAAKVFSSTGDALDEMSQRTGVSVTTLSALQFAAEQTGSSIGAVATAFKVLSKNVAAANAGNKAAVSSLREIGLSAKQLIGLTPDKQLELIADRIAAIQNPTLRSAAAQKIFGRSAQELIPLLSEGAAGIRRFVAEAERLGITLDPEAASAAGAFNDSLDALKTQVKFLIANIGGALVPELAGYVERMKSTVAQSIQWIKANQKLIVLVAKASAVILGGGAALIATGLAIRSLGAIVGILPAAFAILSAGVNGVAGGFRLLVFAITALKSPIAIVTLSLSGLAAWFLSSTKSGQAFIASLKGGFASLAATAAQSFKAIAAALQRGNIEAAWDVLTATINLGWETLRNTLTATWGEVVTSIKLGISDLVTAFAVAINGMAVGWQLFSNSAASSWEIGVSNMLSGIDDLATGSRLLFLLWGKGLAEWGSQALEVFGIVNKGFSDVIASVAKGQAGEILDASNKRRDDIDTRIEKAKREHANNLIDIAADGQARETDIIRQAEVNREKIRNAGDKRLDDARKRLEDAKAQLEEANKDAFGRRFAGEGGGNIGFAEGRRRRIGAEFDGADIDGAEPKKIINEARGVFNVAALQSVAGGTGPERLIFLAEEGNKTAKDMLREIRRGVRGRFH